MGEEAIITIDLLKGFATNGLLLSENQETLSSILEATSTSGFFYVSNHGIEQQEIDQMFLLGQEFFTLPTSEKESWPRTSHVGYCKLGQERLSEKFEFDLREAVNLPPFFSNFKENLPTAFKNKIPLLDSFTKSCHNLGKKILRLLAISLELEPDYFEESHVYGQPTGSIMRLLHYPPVPENVNTNKVTRAGSHSDYGTMTLLFQESSGSDVIKHSGLQILKSESDGTSRWVDIPTKPGCIIVNIADLLSIWSEGKLKSALHQVILPESEIINKSRYSMAYFLHPNSDYPIYPFSNSKSSQDQKNSSGVMTNIGPSPFTYGETDRIYLKKRFELTYEAPDNQWDKSLN